MRPKLWFAMSLAIFTGACAHGGKGTGETVLLQPGDRGIHVTGEGMAGARPDTVVFRVGVQARRPSVAEAREASARAVTAMMEALRAEQVDEANIQTEQLSIRPEFEHTEQGRRQIGYVATNTVRVRMHDLDRVSAAVDATVRAGGNDAQLRGMEFRLEDDEEARAAAREEAMNKARARAEQLAQLAGVKLGAPIAVQESRSGGGPQPVAMRAMAEADTATPVQPGQTDVTVRVSVRYAIR
jgi:hypothetical protein